MKEHLVGLVLGAALSAGCIGPEWSKPATEVPVEEQGHIYVCLDLPDASLPGAHDAVAQWDRALHQWRHVDAVDHGKPWLDTCTVWVHEGKVGNDDDGRNHVPLAQTSVLGGFEITLKKGWYEQDTSGILQHELGHAFGAQHVFGTLMTPHWVPGAFVCPDRTTVAQVAAWWRIDMGILSYCY